MELGTTTMSNILLIFLMAAPLVAVVVVQQLHFHRMQAQWMTMFCERQSLTPPNTVAKEQVAAAAPPRPRVRLSVPIPMGPWTKPPLPKVKTS